jgi:hypothetical protein
MLNTIFLNRKYYLVSLICVYWLIFSLYMGWVGREVGTTVVQYLQKLVLLILYFLVVVIVITGTTIIILMGYDIL